MDTLGALIEQWKTRTGKTQTEFSELIGVGQKTVSRWANDQVVPHPKQRPALLKLLNTRKDPEFEAIFESALVATKAVKAARKTAPRVRYVTQVGQLNAWTLQMVGGTTDKELSALLMLFPVFAHANGEVHITEGEYAQRVGAFSVDEVLALWGEVLASPYIEPIPGKRWVFRLKFVEEL